MKRILLITLGILLGSSFCFAQTAKYGTPQTVVAKPPVTMTMVGKVQSVTVGNRAKKIRSELVVNNNGKTVSFFVPSSASILDTNSKPLSLGQMTKNAEVKITYTRGRADAIQLMK